MSSKEAKRPFQPFGVPQPKKKPPAFKPSFLQPSQVKSTSDLLPTMDFDEMMRGLKAEVSSMAQSALSSSASREEAVPEVSSAQDQKTEALRRTKYGNSGSSDILQKSSEVVHQPQFDKVIPEENLAGAAVQTTNIAEQLGRKPEKQTSDGWSSDEDNEQEFKTGDRKLETQKSRVEELKEFHESCIDQTANQKQSQQEKPKSQLHLNSNNDLNKDQSGFDQQVFGQAGDVGNLQEDDYNNDEKQVLYDSQGSDPWTVNQFDEKKFQPQTEKRAFVPSPVVETEKKNQKMLDQLKAKTAESQNAGENLGRIPEAVDGEESSEGWGSDDEDEEKKVKDQHIKQQKIQSSKQENEKKTQNLIYKDRDKQQSDNLEYFDDGNKQVEPNDKELFESLKCQLINDDDHHHQQYEQTFQTEKQIKEEEEEEEGGDDSDWGSETEYQIQNKQNHSQNQVLQQQQLQQQQQLKTSNKSEQFVPRVVQLNQKQRVISGRPTYAKTNPYEVLTRDEPTVIPQKPFKRVAEFIQNKNNPTFYLLAGDFDEETDENDSGCLLDDYDEKLVQLIQQSIQSKKNNAANQQVQQEETKLIRKKRAEGETTRKLPLNDELQNTNFDQAINNVSKKSRSDDVQDVNKTKDGQLHEQNQSFGGNIGDKQFRGGSVQQSEKIMGGGLEQDDDEGSAWGSDDDAGGLQQGDVGDQLHSDYVQLQPQRDSGTIGSEYGGQNSRMATNDVEDRDGSKQSMQTEGVQTEGMLIAGVQSSICGKDASIVSSSKSMLMDLKNYAQSIELQMQNMAFMLSTLKGKIQALEDSMQN